MAKAHLEKACRVLAAREAATSKCREKCKTPGKPILVGDPEETPPLMCHCTHLYHHLCHFTSTLKRRSSIRWGDNKFSCKVRLRRPLRLQQPHLPQAL
jgi:hypothetical protein